MSSPRNDSHHRLRSAGHRGSPTGAQFQSSRSSRPSSPLADREPVAKPKSPTPVLYSQVVLSSPEMDYAAAVPLTTGSPELRLNSPLPTPDELPWTLAIGRTARTHQERSHSMSPFSGFSNSGKLSAMSTLLIPVATEQMSRRELLELLRRHEQPTAHVTQGWFPAHQSAVILNKDGPGNDANISLVTQNPQQQQSPVVIPLFDARSAPPLASSQGSHLAQREVRAQRLPVRSKAASNCVIESELPIEKSAKAHRTHVSPGSSSRPVVVSAPSRNDVGEVSGRTNSERIAILQEEISRLTQYDEELKTNLKFPSNRAKQAVRDSIANQIRKDTSAPRTELPRKSASARLAAGSYITDVIRNASMAAPPSPDASDGSSSSSSDSEPNGRPDDKHQQKRPQSVILQNRRYESRGSNKPPRKQKMLLKPIPPTAYDGRPEVGPFQRFICEGSAYLKAGRVPEDQQLFFLSYHLKGKALNFYDRKVVKDESLWTLQDFFWGLYEFCFPPDFRMKQRQQLENCFQGEKTVTDHISELEELYSMIGLVDDQEKVVKLWRSLRGDIQREMYRASLDPEVSSWDQVSDAAEHAEIILTFGAESSNEQELSDDPDEPDEHQDQDSEDSDSRRSGGRSNADLNHEVDTESPESHDDESEPAKLHGEESDEKYDESWSPSQLSPEKRRQLLVAGLCFYCEEPGHIAWDCPAWQEESEPDEFYEEYDPDWSPSKLSPAKRRELLAARLCFYCEGPGHEAYGCPVWQEDYDYYEENAYNADEGEYEED
ncbi:hypothetical protein C8J57DRAFT_1656991 [Mycena rebaudengoi]|nr:hypothetical protein C8J57DRAFT_1656991 [Mycena rebaudengoi]